MAEFTVRLRRLASLLLFLGALLTTPHVLAANAAFISGTYQVTPSTSGSTAGFNVAGIRNTTTNVISGSLGFELWYLDTPYSGGTVTGYKVAAQYLPIGQCTASTLQPGQSCTGIQVTASLTSPPAGIYYPVLFLVEYSSTCGTNSGYCLDDYKALTVTQTGAATVTVGTGSGSTPSSTGISIVGAFSITPLSASTTQLNVARIQNSSTTRSTGTLRLELWLTTAPYGGGSINGYRIGTYQIASANNGSLGPAQSFTNISTTMTLVNLPSAGSYYATLLVTEFSSTCTTNDGFCIATYGGFSAPYVVGANSGTSGAISLAGSYSYDVDFSASTLKLNVAKLQNASTTRTTGRLRLDLWLTAKAYSGGDISGNRVGTYTFTGDSAGTLGPSQFFSNVAVTVPLTNLPSAGSYFATFVVMEFSQNCGSTDGYCIATYGPFAAAFTVPAPVTTSSGSSSGGGSGGGGGALDGIGLLMLSLLVPMQRLPRRTSRNSWLASLGLWLWEAWHVCGHSHVVRVLRRRVLSLLPHPSLLPRPGRRGRHRLGQGS